MSTEPEVKVDQGVPNEEPIEGGFVSELGDVPYEQKARAETARSLAFVFALLLAISGGAHYLSVLCLGIAGKDEAIKNLSTVFNVWLPVISGLVGSAATYYFTRDR